MKFTKLIIFVFLFALFFTSCTVVSNLSYAEKHSLVTKVSSSDFFCNLAEDLSSFQKDDKNILETAFDETVFNLENDVNVRNVRKSKNAENNYYEISFDFERFDSPVITTEDGKIEFNLNMQNYESLKEIIPLLADENIAAYGPEYNSYYTEEDYLTMMEFIAGSESRDSILSSYVTIRIISPKDIKKTNGKVVETNIAEYSFKLLDFLLLHKPIVFTVEY